MKRFRPYSHTREGDSEVFLFIMPKGNVVAFPILKVKTCAINITASSHGTVRAYVDGEEVREAAQGDIVELKAVPDKAHAGLL